MKKYLIAGALLILAPQAWAKDDAAIKALVKEIAAGVGRRSSVEGSGHCSGCQGCEVEVLTLRGSATAFYLANRSMADGVKRRIKDATDRMERMRAGVEQMQKNMGLEPEYSDEELQKTIAYERQRLEPYEKKAELLKQILLKNGWAKEKITEIGADLELLAVPYEDFKYIGKYTCKDEYPFL